MTSISTVFLVDVDNTLLDNDRIKADLKRHLEKELGADCRDQYWTILPAILRTTSSKCHLSPVCGSRRRI